MFSIQAHFHRACKHIRVTFSSKISNCFSTDPRRRCECSSTTRIFHLPGGFTERIASRNSVTKIGRQCRECMSYTGGRRRSEPSRSARACGGARRTGSNGRYQRRHRSCVANRRAKKLEVDKNSSRPARCERTVQREYGEAAESREPGRGGVARCCTHRPQDAIPVAVHTHPAICAESAHSITFQPNPAQLPAFDAQSSSHQPIACIPRHTGPTNLITALARSRAGIGRVKCSLYEEAYGYVDEFIRLIACMHESKQ